MLGGRSFGGNVLRIGKAVECPTALSLGIEFNCACCAVEHAPVLTDRCGVALGVGRQGAEKSGRYELNERGR